MHRILPRLAALFSLLLLSVSVRAQLSLNTADTLYAWGPVSAAEIVAYSGVRNNSDNPGNFRWVRTSNAQVTGWQTSICDLNTCYLPTTDSADFNLIGRGNSNIDCHLYPNQTLGTGTVVVRIFEITNRANAVTVVYRFSTHAAGLNEPNAVRLTAFPNPTPDWVAVEVDPRAVRSFPARICDSRGSVVQRTELHPGRNPIDLGMLPSGVYLLSSEDHSIRTSLRLVKH